MQRYEAIHPIKTWEDMKPRLGKNKRVFAFFHPSMPAQPLILLHVALMKDIPLEVSQVLGGQIAKFGQVITQQSHFANGLEYTIQGLTIKL